MSSSAFAAANCSDGTKTSDCSCPNGYTATCAWGGGAFCQNPSPTGADKDCAPGANGKAISIKSVFSTGTVKVINGKVQTAAPGTSTTK